MGLFMERVTRDPTERSPFVDFDFPNGLLTMRGESYPENAAAFFGPLLEALRTFLDRLSGARVKVTLEMAYFNSSTAKALMNMFQALEEAAHSGNEVTIYWCYHPEDDTMEEFGLDFAEDFHAAHFHLHATEAL